MTKLEKKYRVLYLLPLDNDEKIVDEFIQKFETEITTLGGKVENSLKFRQQMVKTSMNKGSRNVYLVTTFFYCLPEKLEGIRRYLNLTQSLLVNYSIFKCEKEPKIPEATLIL